MAISLASLARPRTLRKGRSTKNGVQPPMLPLPPRQPTSLSFSRTRRSHRRARYLNSVPAPPIYQPRVRTKLETSTHSHNVPFISREDGWRTKLETSTHSHNVTWEGAMLGFNVFVVFLLVLFIFIVVAGVKIVPQGYNYTVERFGRYTRTLRPGLTLIIPVIDRIGRKLNMM